MMSRFAFLILLLAASSASADECDVSGHYQVKIEWTDKKCLAPDAETTDLLILKEGGGYEVRDPRGARFAVTGKTTEAGTCKLGLVETVDHYTSGAGPADYVRFDLDLSVAGAHVAGTGRYDELGPDANAATPKCQTHVSVTGLRTPMAAGDLVFDEAAAKQQLVGLLQSMSADCDLPYFATPRKGKAQVEVQVAAGGGASGFRIDGADQNLGTTCDGFQRSFLTDFKNPSGKARTVRVAVDLAQIHPRAKAKDLVVLPADPKPVSLAENDCRNAVQGLMTGSEDDMRGYAKEVCEHRKSHKAARDRLLASLGRIVTNFRDDTNHDHAKNLPTTIKSLQDILKSCLAAVESQEWCHNIGCAIEPEENAAFCEARAADVADGIVSP